MFNTHERDERALVLRQSRLEVLALTSLLFGAVALALSLFTASRDFAWIVAIVCIALSTLSLALHVTRTGVAATAMMLGGFAFAFSFAMVTWGSP